MNRFSFFLISFFLGAALVPAPAHAFGEVARWADKTLPQALKEALGGTAIWHRVPAGLNAFSPKPEQPLAMKSACADKTDSAFYSELEERGAIVTKGRGCNHLILWYDAGNSGLTYSFGELQKKFLPFDSEAEAVSFLIASGENSGLPWYGASVENVIYLMSDEAYCRGHGHFRRIFRMGKDGRGKIIGSVNEPPLDKGLACGG